MLIIQPTKEEKPMAATNTDADMSNVKKEKIFWNRVIGVGVIIGLLFQFHNGCESRFNKIDASIADSKTETNKRFDKVDARLDKIDDRLDRVIEALHLPTKK